MARILIAGCGDVGTALGLRLVADGHEVFGLRRRPQILPAALRGLRADLTRPAELRAVLPEVDRVVYAAAAGGRNEDAYRRAYEQGLSAVLEVVASRSPAVERVLFVSSTSVYGDAAGARVDECTPAVPDRFTGRVLLDAERVLSGCGIAGAAVRFAGIYGPGRTRMLDRARAGVPCVDEPPLYTNRIHRDDCAGVLAHLLDVDRIDPVYIGVDHAQAPECEVLTWVSGELGGRPPRPVAAGEEGTSTGAGKRCSNARLVASGYEFIYPTYREGYAAVIAGRGVRYD